MSDGAADRREADRYARFVASPEYRANRTRKATVIAALCAAELEAAERPADLGAGTGIVKKVLEDKFAKKIVGFEIDNSFIRERERMVVADATRLPVADDAFDFIILNHVYEHVPDQAALFDEVARVLTPGAVAYMSAGNRLAIIEPHYRLPFLSWLPKPLADRYVRWTRRGSGYAGIRFRTYRRLVAVVEGAQLRVRDITERAIQDQLAEAWGEGWVPAWRAFIRMPERIRRRLLRNLSPQWFFMLERPVRAVGHEGPASGPLTEGSPGDDATEPDRQDRG